MPVLSENDVLPVAARQWKNGTWRTIAESAAREVRLHVLHENNRYALWAWPHGLEDLALGHVLLEHMRDAPGGSPVAYPSPEGIHVEAPGEPQSPGDVLALRVTLSGVPIRGDRDSEPGSLSADAIMRGMRAFIDAPGLWDGTGCFHRSGILRAADESIVRIAEDIGRHNCLDRLAGYAAREGLNLGGYVLLLSARITASLYAKARRAGFVFLISRAAVTEAALSLAEEQGITLVGFCRPGENRLTVFTDTRGRVQ